VNGTPLTGAPPASSVAHVARRVVCISHASGAGGEEVGRIVAERLGFARVDEEIVAEAAAKGGIDPGEVADEERREARRRSLAARLLEAMAQSGAEAWTLGVPVHPGEDVSDVDPRALIREAIEQTAARGNVVIVAHAASHALTAGPDVLRVLVTASPATRAARLSGALRLRQASADRAVKDADAGRRDYLKRFYGIDEESATQYDLVVNTDVLSIEQAAQLVVQACAA
jgi:cytidylate kinase